MPIFYNTSDPTPTTSNSINNVSIDIRDFLLNQNISSTYPSISTAVNGSPRVGEPVLDTESNHLNFYPHQQLDLNTTGLDILGSVLNGQGVGIGAGGSPVPNFDVRSSLVGRVLGATGLLNDTRIGTIGAQQLALALANNAAFNVQQDLLGALNVQDNVLALVKGAPLPGFRPSYQITIPSGGLARAADFTGKVLGFTIPRSYLSDGGSIFQDENDNNENIARANSMILNTGKGQVLALLANAEANLTVNSAKEGNPMYSPFRSGYAPGYTNNKGVVKVRDPKLYAFSNDNKNFEKILAITDGAIPDLAYLREGKVESAGFKDPTQAAGHTTNLEGRSSNLSYDERLVNSIPFTWTSEPKSNLVNAYGDYQNSKLLPSKQEDKKSLLVKTQKLFNSTGMKNIVSVKGDMDKKSTQISQANGKGFSKGNAVLRRELFTNGVYNGAENLTADETYCRSWTTLNRYDKVSKLVRHGASDYFNGLYDKNQVPYRDTPGQSVGSILDEFGFPKIVPYTKDKGTDIKQYMFSIENLAWADVSSAVLPPAEIGSGDLVTGKKGRIMWFPPYDINFSESNSVSWESTNFIGRGEPIYTYNNTERSGNLSFKIVVDHPSYANSFRSDKIAPDDHYINSFWAGCIPPEFKNVLTQTESDKIENLQHNVPQQANLTPEVPPPFTLSVFFPNDRSDLPPDGYENGLSGSSPTSYIDYYENTMGYGYGINSMSVPAQQTPGLHLQNGKGWIDNTNYGMNGYTALEYAYPVFFADTVFWGWRDRVALMAEVDKYLKEKCKFCRVVVKGFASQQGTSTANTELIKKRANNVIEELKKYLFNDLPPDKKKDRFRYETGYVPQTAGCRVGIESDIQYLPCKRDRRAEITFEWVRELAEKEIKLPDLVVNDGTKTVTTRITDRFYNEMLYFDQLTDADPLVFDSFRQSIKYFHPAFHSTTPEGLNSRLTFLLQCTRQGPTSEAQGPNNLAFGRPPVCILRIGDFYHTKIVMDSVNIDYEPLVWDLNPEGIGVQPMIANVTIAFKFLGGSSLMGPINKLQNALSFNYFANTQVYDARADYISKNKPTFTVKNKEGKDVPQTPADSLSGYYLNDGVLASTNLLKEELPAIYTLPNDSNVDEIKTQDKDLTGAEVTQTPLTLSAGTIDDKNKTWNVSYDFSGNHIMIGTGDPTEAVSGTWTLKITIPDGLNKEYDLSVRVCDATSRTNELYVGKVTTQKTEQIFSYPMNFTADNFTFVQDVFNDSTIFTPKYQMLVELKQLNMKAYNITF